MVEEWEAPKNQPAKLKDLASLSIAELKDYIDGLKAEIVRAEAEIGRKQIHRGQISGLFKS